MKCKHCGGKLPPHVERVSFTDAAGKLQYHPHNFAQWEANRRGHLDAIESWTQSARGSKEGLVTGYSYRTDKWGHEGKAEFCSMDCAAQAAAVGVTATAASDASRARPAIVPDLVETEKIDGPALRKIREALKLSQPTFALALGYVGERDVRQTAVSRLENGKRPISERVRLRAAILAKGVLEKA